MQRVPPPRRAYWICQLVGWSSYAALMVPVALGAGMPIARVVAEPIIGTCVGILLTGQIRSTLLRRGWLRLKPLSLALRIGVLSFGLAGVHVAVLGAVAFGVFGERPDSLALALVGSIAQWASIFSVWTILYCVVTLLRERRQEEVRRLRLEMEVRTASLRSLESQLNPHFLFNALNSVRALITEDPEQAKLAVTRLARLLRYTLNETAEDLVTFERELEIVESYLGIESVRLGDRLAIERSISASAKDARIPFMLLQTLVENGIKHGIAHLAEGGTLSISARDEDGVVDLVVTNPRSSLASAADLSKGVGLTNARERLALLFGERASLELVLTEGRATARARIPRT